MTLCPWAQALHPTCLGGECRCTYCKSLKIRASAKMTQCKDNKESLYRTSCNSGRTTWVCGQNRMLSSARCCLKHPHGSCFPRTGSKWNLSALKRVLYVTLWKWRGFYMKEQTGRWFCMEPYRPKQGSIWSPNMKKVQYGTIQTRKGF